ncbi:MAG: carboxypeptidase regulatory-like domain-containing protein [Pseudomonadota bacterium]
MQRIVLLVSLATCSLTLASCLGQEDSSPVGTVQGALQMGDGASADGAEVTLRGASAVRSTKAVGDAFSFADVPVGEYEVSARKVGYTKSKRAKGSASGCGEQVIVGKNGDKVVVPILTLAPTTVGLAPGAGEVFLARGGTWHLTGPMVTIRVDSAYAEEGRVWIDDETVPAYSAFEEDGYVLDQLPEGATAAHLQFTDGCDYESPVHELSLVRDETAPAIEFVRLSGGAAYTTEPTVSLAVAASDALAAALEMRLAVCSDSGTTIECDVPLEGSSWVPFQELRPVTLDGGDGAKRVEVQVRDEAGNSSEVASAAITLDTEAPAELSLRIAGGRGTIYSASPDVTVTATGASFMQVGTESGLKGIPWQPLSLSFPYNFPPEEGEKHLYARFRDDAGNPSEEIHASATLVLRGTVNGKVMLEGSGDPSTIEVVLIGTTYRTAVETDGSFSIPGVPEGSYLAELRGTGDLASKWQTAQALASVAAGKTTTLSTVTLLTARGDLVGTVALEGASEHGGVLVEIAGTALTANTTVTGAYSLSGVPVGSYSLHLSKPGFIGTTVASVAVANGERTPVPAQQLLLRRGGVAGKVVLEGGGDPSVVEVALLGTSHLAMAATDGGYTIEGVPSSNYLAEYRGTGGAAATYRPAQAVATVTAGSTTTLPAVTLALTRGDLVGQVTLEKASDFGGVLVEVVGTAQFTTTLPSGAYAIASVPVGTYHVRLSKTGFVSGTVTGIAVEDAEQVTVPAQQLLISRGSMSGIARLDDSTDHSGIVVAVIGTTHQATTAAEGSWSIAGLPPGFYNLEATRDGYLAARENALYVDSAKNTATGTLLLPKKKGIVAGVARLEGYSDHTGVAVSLIGTTFSTTTAADGTFQLTVPLGNYAGVRATREQFKAAESLATITVTESGIANVPLLNLLAVTNDARGRVTLFGRLTHDGVVVEINGVVGESTAGAYQALTTQDPAGSFTINALALGPYYVKYSNGAGWETITRYLEVRAGPPVQLGPEQLRERYLVINANAAHTIQTAVTLSLGSSDCYQMKVSNLPDLVDAGWETCAATKAWTLAGPDGTNMVYARFRNSALAESEVLSDGIWLDRAAAILSVSESTGGATMHRGDTIHLALAAYGETGGSAIVDIAGYEAGIGLFDDGTHGDATTDDGVYELDYRVSLSTDVNGALVTGRFADQYGNEATPVNAAGAVTVAIPPLIRNIRVVPNSATGVATISWETDEQANGRLDWGPDQYYGNQANDAACAYSHSLVIGGGTLVPSTPYHYRITAVDLAGNQSMTVDAVFYMQPNPPELVIALPGDGRFDVRWEAPPQENVVGYNVYKSTASGGPYSRLNGAVPYTHEALMYSDREVVNGTGYYYVVTAVDEHGNESQLSTEIAGTPEANGGPSYVSGVLVGSQVWTTKGSPYVVTGNTLVEADNYLAVGPGVEVRFDGFFLIRVDGRIVVVGADGADGAEVLFTSNRASPAPGDWRTIKINPTSPPGRSGASASASAGTYRAGNLLHRARLEYAGEGAITVSDANLTLVEATISNNRNDTATSCGPLGATYPPVCIGGGVTACAGALAFVRTVLASNDGFNPGGDTFWGSQAASAGGLAARGTTVTLLDSMIVENDVPGQIFNGSWSSIRAGGIALADGVLAIQGGTISDNRVTGSFNEPAAGGIALSGSTSKLSATTLAGNQVLPVGLLEAGAILALAGNTVVTGAEISHNRANGFYADAGGVFAGGPTAILGSLLADNTGNTAAAIGGSSLEVAACGIAGPLPAGVPAVALRCEDRYGGIIECGGSTLSWNHFASDLVAGDVVFSALGSNSVLRGNSLFAEPPSPSCVVCNESGFASGAVDAAGNYWGPATTTEMDSRGASSDLAAICDYYDDFDFSKVSYDDWAHSAFPLARIDAPYWGQKLEQSTTVTLAGHADDLEDGPITGAALSWFDETDGVLGVGDTLDVSTLSVGHHQVWLTATDSLGQEGKVRVEFDVVM